LPGISIAMDEKARQQIEDLKKIALENSTIPAAEIHDKVKAGMHELDVVIDGHHCFVTYTIREDNHLLSVSTFAPEDVVRQVVAAFLDCAVEISLNDGIGPETRHFIQSADPSIIQHFPIYYHDRRNLN